MKEKVFSALVSAVKTLQQERATILNALVRMRMRYIGEAVLCRFVLVSWTTAVRRRGTENSVGRRQLACSFIPQIRFMLSFTSNMAHF